MNIDSKKICFITCVNNEKYEQEERKYISNLCVPEGFVIEICPVKHAVSMASGYNCGMRSSNAKYKVYLHQDVFIVNPYFIQDILSVFQNADIGMLGMVGTRELPDNAIMWEGPRIGKLYVNAVYKSQNKTFGEIDGLWECAEAIDGLLMATQYDITWREDLFKGWDFYDVSQSQEFIRNGYKVVVPNQKEPWCIHDDGFYSLKSYYEARKIFIAEYKKGIRYKKDVRI